MQDYKTPGVYVEEIPKLPPSIASVETAIPGFIGYTEKAQWKEPDDLKNKPWRISSLLEYVQYFGNPAPEVNSLSVSIKAGKHIDVQFFLLFACHQEFRANGIINVNIRGSFPHTAEIIHLGINTCHRR